MIEKFLAQVPDHEDPERFEIPEINRLLNELTYAASLGLLTGVGLPLIARQKVVGLLFIFRSYAGVFSSNDYALLSSFANQAAIAVQNAQLYTQVNQEKVRLSALLDSMADGILILDPQNRIERCNPALSRMIGLPAERYPGQTARTDHPMGAAPQGMTLEQAEAGGWPLTPHAHLYVEGDLKHQTTSLPCRWGSPMPR